MLLFLSLKGNPVQFWNGPAAVIGDDYDLMPLIFTDWEGVIIRMIRESEDLSEKEFITESDFYERSCHQAG